MDNDDEDTPSSPLEYTSFLDNEHVLATCFSFLSDQDLLAGKIILGYYYNVLFFRNESST